MWVWVKIKPQGTAWFKSLVPFIRVPFGVPIFDPQPCLVSTKRFAGFGSLRSRDFSTPFLSECTCEAAMCTGEKKLALSASGERARKHPHVSSAQNPDWPCSWMFLQTGFNRVIGRRLQSFAAVSVEPKVNGC